MCVCMKQQKRSLSGPLARYIMCNADYLSAWLKLRPDKCKALFLADNGGDVVHTFVVCNNNYNTGPAGNTEEQAEKGI